MNKDKIVIDFDGLLNTYKSNENLFKPLPNAENFLKKLSKDCDIYVFTVRDRTKVYRWLIEYNLNVYIKDVINKKRLKTE